MSTWPNSSTSLQPAPSRYAPRDSASYSQFAAVLGEHDAFEQLVVRGGCRVGPRRVVVADGDGCLAVRSARVKIEDADAITRHGVAARRPDGVFQRIGAALGECTRNSAGHWAVR